MDKSMWRTSLRGWLSVQRKSEGKNLKKHSLYIGRLSPFSLMELVNSNWKVGETKMNDKSSRSHTIFRITLESQNRRDDDTVDSSLEGLQVGKYLFHCIEEVNL